MRSLEQELKNADRKLDAVEARIAQTPSISVEEALAKIELGLMIQGPYDWEDHAHALARDGLKELRRLLKLRSVLP